MPSRGGPANFGSRNRLKPVNIDPLEAVGLPSKEDRRLLDRKTQERYYTKIIDRYMAFCSDAGHGAELSRRLVGLDIAKDNGKQDAQTQPTQQLIPTYEPDDSIDIAHQRELSILKMAMRKLREGIKASRRVDNFSIQAYLFCIRFSILLKDRESYQPALLHLLNEMHRVRKLASTELQEFAGYLVLDLACRQDDLAQAHMIRNQYSLRDAKIDAVLRALAHDNYFLFWRVQRTVDAHKAKLMGFAEDGMKRQALKCIGRSYLTIDLAALERYTNTPWYLLTKDYSVGWQLEGLKVIIRKPKTR